MCLFVEKFLKTNMGQRTKRSSKEPSRDASANHDFVHVSVFEQQ